jgi:predicted enzyme related to lactoylglutathione lyase
MITSIAFSIYPVIDIARSRKFYEGILGLVPSDEYKPTNDSKWIEYNIGGGTLAIGCSPEWRPSSDGASVALEVDNFDEMITNLKTAGVTFRVEPMKFPGCSMTAFYDPDRNVIMIHQKNKK